MYNLKITMLKVIVMKKMLFTLITLSIALTFIACSSSSTETTAKCGASKKNKNSYIEGDSHKKCGASNGSKCGTPKTDKNGYLPAG